MATALAPEVGVGRRRVAPPLGIVAVAGFAFAIAALLLGGGAELVQLAFPAGAVLLALVLFRTAPALWLGFVTALWLSAPFVRRVVDYHVGWTAQSPVLLAPLLASAVACWTLLWRSPSLRLRRLAPFAPAVAALVFGYVNGIVQNGIASASYTLLAWVVPLAVGFHLAVDWPRHDGYRRALVAALVWGGLVAAAYGIWQWTDPQPWDRYWMAWSRMTTIGRPEPYLVRVFGPLNSPTPFAVVLMGTIAFGLAARGLVRWVALPVALVALLLSLVRTAWVGLLLLLVLYAFGLPGRLRLRLLGAVVTLGILLTPALGVEEVNLVVQRRIDTLLEPASDKSVSDRRDLYERSVETVRDHPLGFGLGATGGGTQLAADKEGIRDLDSGVLDLFVSLGWPGGLLMLLTLVAIAWALLADGGAMEHDRVATAARALAVSMLVLMLSYNTLTNVSGFVFWSAAGLAMGARRHALVAGASRVAAANLRHAA